MPGHIASPSIPFVIGGRGDIHPRGVKLLLDQCVPTYGGLGGFAKYTIREVKL